MATLCGLPRICCCQRATPLAIGWLVLIQDHSLGNGFQTPVLASTTTATTAASP